MTPLGPRLREALLAGRREGRRGIGGASLRRSDGYEFAELRAYVDGDDPRRIDWAATARAGALQTRVILEERALFLAVALDASLSMYVGRNVSNYDLACEAATRWFDVALDDDRCARLGREPLVLGDVRGRAGAFVCAARREPRGTALEESLRLALATLPRGARLLAVSDFFNLENERALLLACAARFDLTALFARDPWHEGFPLRGFVRLRDAESDRTSRTYVGKRARGRYLAAVAERERSVLEQLRAMGARAGTLDEASGALRSLARTFGL